MRKPRLVIVLSGKRKSGKDHVAERLQAAVRAQGFSVCLVRLSAPLKQQYAADNGIDFERTLTSDAYKETYRDEMIKYGERMRAQHGTGYFCTLAIQAADPQQTSDVWIVSDCRRPGDVEYFEKMADSQDDAVLLFKVRLTVTDGERAKRGWSFVAGVDDAESECALDDFNRWNYRLDNNSDEQINQFLDELVPDFVRCLHG